MIGYHASHEQYAPSTLLDYVALAETAGFKSIMSSDHSSPWSEAQGHSGFTWSWLGAAMQKTTLPFGTLSIPLGYRYHPFIVAQASATLAELFPGRLRWIAAGSGEASNEIMVGEGWPEKNERLKRLEEGVSMIRRLWAGETVTEKNGLIRAENARLWSLPEILPAIVAPALTPESAYRAGAWADAMVTVRKPREDALRMIEAFHQGGGEGKKLILQLQVAWAPTKEEAVHMAWDQWRFSLLPSPQLAEISTPQEFDREIAHITPEEVAQKILISSDASDHISWIREYQSLGFEEIYIHNVCRNQDGFIKFYQKYVLPHL